MRYALVLGCISIFALSCAPARADYFVFLSSTTTISPEYTEPVDLFNPFAYTGLPGVYFDGGAYGTLGTVTQITSRLGDITEKAGVGVVAGVDCESYSSCLVAQLSPVYADTLTSGSLPSASLSAWAYTSGSYLFTAPDDTPGDYTVAISATAADVARIADVITFQVPPSMENETVTATVNMNVHGGVLGGAVAPVGIAQLQVGNVSEAEALGPAIGTNTQISVSQVIHYAGQPDVSLPITAEMILSGSVNLAAFGLTGPGDGFTEGITNGIDADYQNTGYITFDLPQGVTYTSESGVFLTQPYVEPSTIPEPSSVLMLLSGAITLLTIKHGRYMSAKKIRSSI